MDDKVYKSDKTAAQRVLRLLRATFDPRAYLHAFKILNYHNYTHVRELRQATRGARVRISPTASFANGRNIVLGDDARIGANCYLWAGNDAARIMLGRNVMLAPGVMITASSYRFNEGSPVTRQPMKEADVILGEDVWIGYGAVILPGSRIGNGAIIGAGAVVKGVIPDNGIVATEPSRVVGYRQLRQGGSSPD